MESKAKFINILKNEEIRDYTYIILFLFIASVFAFLVIKPALSIAFSLQREASDLRRIKQVYEKNNAQLISIELALESTRDKLYLLDLALPKKPSTKVLIDDIKRAAQKENVVIGDLNLAGVDLKSEKITDNVKTLTVTMDITGSYEDLSDFMSRLLNQKRIKAIKSLTIVKDDIEATSAATLRSVLELKGYYL